MIKPMLCQGAPKPFNASTHIWERKYDGIRCLISVEAGGKYRIQSRSGQDKTRLFPELKLQTRASFALFDGEIISGESFNNIQHRSNRENGISQAVDSYPAVFQAFDILEMADENLMRDPLVARKELLGNCLIETENVKIAPTYDDGIALFEQAKLETWEGIVGKTKMGVYLPNAREWLKVKLWRRNYGPDSTKETFLVVGYSQGTGWRTTTFGSLILAKLDGQKLVYVGAVGTGFNDAEIQNICSKFIPAPCVFPVQPEPATWIKPFAIKLQYLELTNDGKVRFPSYKGMI